MKSFSVFKLILIVPGAWSDKRKLSAFVVNIALVDLSRQLQYQFYDRFQRRKIIHRHFTSGQRPRLVAHLICPEFVQTGPRIPVFALLMWEPRMSSAPSAGDRPGHSGGQVHVFPRRHKRQQEILSKGKHILGNQAYFNCRA